MIITKDEKKIYSFLDIVYMLFGKVQGRNVLFAVNNGLYFYCKGYAGYFNQDDYSFDEGCYQIGKSPDGNYTIENERYLEMLEIGVANRINGLINKSSKRLEIASKVEEYKIAKITIDTGFWLKDEDLKILTKYRFFTVQVPFEEKDMLIISEGNNHYLSDIIFNFDCSFIKPVTQLTFDTVEEEEKPVVVISSKEQLDELTASEEEDQLDELMTEAEEDETLVNDDDYDPMA